MITDEELENLPEDPDMAFVEFEKIMRSNVQAALVQAQPDSGDEYRLEYINKVLAAAKVYNIDALKNWSVPSASNDNVYVIYKNFLSDVDHYIIQIRLQNISRTKKFSVALDAAAKIKIHHFIALIRKAIEQQSDLEEHKKNKLYDLLNEFSKEVDRSRTSWQSAMSVYIAVCTALGDGVERLEPVRKWLDSISRLLGQAKEVEDNMPRLAHIERKKLEPPRQEDDAPELDDEIPF